MLSSNDGKMLIIIVALVLVVVCSVGGVCVMKMKAHKGGGKDGIPEGPATMVSVGEMVVNLADTREIRYLKVDAVLEVHGKVEAGGEGEGGDAAFKAPLRDALITVMSSKRLGELSAPGGKDELKTEIMAACNKHLEEAKVTNVYFNEFAMQ